MNHLFVGYFFFLTDSVSIVYMKTYYVFFSVIRVMTTRNGHSDSASYAVQEQKGKKRIFSGHLVYKTTLPGHSLSALLHNTHVATHQLHSLSIQGESHVTCHMLCTYCVQCVQNINYHYRKRKFGHQFTSTWKVSEQ